MTAGNKLTGGTAIFGNIDLVGASYVPKTVKVALTDATTNTTGGEVLAWANPENYAIIVTEVVIDITTVAGQTCTIDVGSVDTANTAPDAAFDVDNLLDGLNAETAGVSSSNDSTLAGTNGRSVAKLAAASAAAPGYVSATVTATQNSTGLVGNAYITYIAA